MASAALKFQKIVLICTYTCIYIHTIFCIQTFLNVSTQLLPIGCTWLWNRRCHFYNKEIEKIHICLLVGRILSIAIYVRYVYSDATIISHDIRMIYS